VLGEASLETGTYSLFGNAADSQLGNKSGIRKQSFLPQEGGLREPRMWKGEGGGFKRANQRISKRSTRNVFYFHCKGGLAMYFSVLDSRVDIVNLKRYSWT
jgi:hypothetical protein